MPLQTEQFKNIDVNTLPNLCQANKLKAGDFAKRTFSIAKPSLVFIERVDMHDSKKLATVYWHDLNQLNGFEGITWATTCRVSDSIAFYSCPDLAWYASGSNPDNRILDAYEKE